MFDLSDDWVWDFWLAQDGPDQHLFFLHAPRSLGDPDLRHAHAAVGHAVSTDLSDWTRLPDALDPAPGPAFDDRAIWTGCTVRGDDGLWRMFYSALSHAEQGPRQRIALATSSDLVTWTRDPGPVWPLEPDPRWYAVPSAADARPHWRDPFVVRDDAGLWHMYVTATASGGGPGSGVVGHAVSPDLASWEVVEPLSVAGTVDQLEVIQVVEVDGRWLLVFSCLAPEIPGAAPGTGGTWVVPVDGPGAPVDVAAATRLTDETLYVAKLARRADGSWCLLAFRHQDDAGVFVGGVVDPLPVRWTPDGTTVACPTLKGFSRPLAASAPRG